MTDPKPDTFSRDVADSLFDSSRKFCELALDDYERDEKDFFLLHAAVALEQLAKAVLASLNPTLIAESDFDSLLHAAGQSRHARRPPQRVKSISMQDALKRCGQLLPGVLQLDSDLELLREIRNGVVHLGLAAEKAEALLIPFLQAAQLLLDELDQSSWVYFGNKTEWVEDSLARAREGKEKDVKEKVSLAKKAFASRFQAMETPWRDQVLQMTVASYEVDGLETHLYECPACGTQGLTAGHVSPDYEVDEEVKHGEFMVYAYLKSVEFLPDEFECKACGLALDGKAEIVAGGIPSSWELEDVDEALLSEWENRGWENI